MAQLVIGVKTYEIADPQALTWAEWRMVKQLCSVLPAEFPTAIGASDPDAWRALVLISIWRVEPKVPAEILDGLNFMEAVVEMVSTWGLDEPEVPEEVFPLAQPPPTGPESAGSEDAANVTNGTASSDVSRTSSSEDSSAVPAATLEDTGSRSSSPASA
jgi:hypothetical protein